MIRPVALMACHLVGHRYRNRVPAVFKAEVYCKRCGRTFASFDSPFARQLWNTDPAARRAMMGLTVGEPTPRATGDDFTVVG